jgi:glycosyltransferase involved in cell wall biosynthesis
MKLVYITTVTTPDTDAQSLQVAAMAESFAFVLGTPQFLFVSPATQANLDLRRSYRWQRVPMLFMSRMWRTWKLMRMLPGIIKREKATHVYTRDIALAYAASKCGAMPVYEAHKPIESLSGQWFFNMVKRQLKVVAISQNLANIFSTEHKMPVSQMMVAHDGVWARAFEGLDQVSCHAALRKLAGERNSKHPIAVYSGNLRVSGKGTALICEAAKSLPGVLFVIAGGRLPQAPGNVIGLGYQDAHAIPELLTGADLLLLPFTRELKTWQYHSALKIFEYMAAGRPIIASSLGSITEVLNSANAVMFNPDAPGDLARAITEALHDRAGSEAKAKRAQEQVAEYDWHERAKKILAFLA